MANDPAGSFAALMASAADQADAEHADQAAEAPYGWTRDYQTGELRPKKAAGRPRKSPSLDELRAQKEQQEQDQPEAEPPPADRAPETLKRKRGKGKGEPKPEKPVPQFREGQIARGMNRLYRRAGKMVRVMDASVGQAMIDVTRKDDEDDLTVGEAWEEVARHNPRIRRFLLRMIAGGAYGQLLWAHAPILLAILMKDAIRQHLPFQKLAVAFLDGGEDGEAPADGTPFDGLRPEDMQDMMGFAQQMAEQMMSSGRGFAPPRPPQAPEQAA